MKTSNPEVKRLARLAFPEYRGRKFSMQARDRAHFDLAGGGGTYSAIKAVHLASGRVEASAPIARNPFSAQSSALINDGLEIPEGWVIVEHAHFCGKDCGLRVYVNPRNVTPALEAGVA